MRRTLLLLFLAALPVTGEVKLVAPLENSQVVGPTLIEATVESGANRVEFFVDDRLVGVARTAPFRHVHDFGVDLRRHSITVVAHSNEFQTTQSATITTLPLSSADELVVNLVEAPLLIRSKANVRISDIEIRENGNVQRLTALNSGRGATHFAFVVDRSLSMKGRKLDAALDAIDAFRSRLRADDTASIVAFNHRVDESIELRAGVPTRELLRNVTASGGTSLRDALVAAKRRGRTVTIAISDGADRNSALSVAETRQEVAARDVTLYALLLGDGDAEPMLRDIAQRTGGAIRRTSAASLEDDLGDVLTALNSRYVAVYQSSTSSSGWRSIEARATRRGISIGATRKGYFAE